MLKISCTLDKLLVKAVILILCIIWLAKLFTAKQFQTYRFYDHSTFHPWHRSTDSLGCQRPNQILTNSLAKVLFIAIVLLNTFTSLTDGWNFGTCPQVCVSESNSHWHAASHKIFIPPTVLFPKYASRS